MVVWQFVKFFELVLVVEHVGYQQLSTDWMKIVVLLLVLV
jgi:hypothetical protein